MDFTAIGSLVLRTTKMAGVDVGQVTASLFENYFVIDSNK